MTQNAFTEWGAKSLNLNVAQQTTNSLRTVFGADLAAPSGSATSRKLDLALRLGWMHEFADTGRPITAAFAGAPSAPSPSTAPRRSATRLIGFRPAPHRRRRPRSTCATTATVGGGTDNHMLNVGVRFSW